MWDFLDCVNGSGEPFRELGSSMNKRKKNEPRTRDHLIPEIIIKIIHMVHSDQNIRLDAYPGNVTQSSLELLTTLCTVLGLQPCVHTPDFRYFLLFHLEAM